MRLLKKAMKGAAEGASEQFVVGDSSAA